MSHSIILFTQICISWVWAIPARAPIFTKIYYILLSSIHQSDISSPHCFLLFSELLFYAIDHSSLHFLKWTPVHPHSPPHNHYYKKSHQFINLKVLRWTVMKCKRILLFHICGKKDHILNLNKPHQSLFVCLSLPGSWLVNYNQMRSRDMPIIFYANHLLISCSAHRIPL